MARLGRHELNGQTAELSADQQFGSGKQRPLLVECSVIVSLSKHRYREYFFTPHTDQFEPLNGDADFAIWRCAAETIQTAKRIVNAHYRRPSEELYNHRTDPDETYNLAEASGQPASSRESVHASRQGD